MTGAQGGEGGGQTSWANNMPSNEYHYPLYAAVVSLSTLHSLHGTAVLKGSVPYIHAMHAIAAKCISV